MVTSQTHIAKTRMVVERPNVNEGPFLKQPILGFTKLLFTDFDGVLHSFRSGVTMSGLARYENIIRDYPELGIVFSTSWRFNQSFETLIRYFSEDLRHRFIGVNPSIQEKWPPYVKHERYKECLKYIELINWEGDWRAIDDADDLFPPKCERLFLTDGNIAIDDQIEHEMRKWLSNKVQ